MEYLQKLGKSLMVPVAVLPIAAILNGIGNWIESLYAGTNAVATFLIESGAIIVDNLPMLFAVSIGVEMSKKKDVIVPVSSIISYLVITHMLSEEIVSLVFNISIKEVPIAFQNTENAFIGILSGIVAAGCFNRFSTTQLPQGLSFFGGKRLVPIICSIIMLGISIVMLVVWPIIYKVLIVFGESIAGLGPLGAGIYAFFNRLLIPIGLHHAINSVFWFDVAGINDIGKFLGRIDGGVLGVTGMYQAGFFPMMMFGLPAAAYAMYKNADNDKKKQIGIIMFPAAVASFLTGVTEPLEFSFMFAAPILYLIHAILTGVFVFIAASFQWIAGFSFSAGLIDFTLSLHSPFANHPFMLLILGLVTAITYYLVFDFCIRKFNLLTPGKEKDDGTITIGRLQDLLMKEDYDEIAIEICTKIGGIHNIIAVDSCITRMHIEVRDITLIDDKALNELGIPKIWKVGNNVQIMIGTPVQFIVEAMNDILES